MKRAADRKYQAELLKLLPKGSRITFEPPRPVNPTTKHRHRRAAHPLVVLPDGEILRLPDGRPVCVCSTPSGPRSLKNDTSAIRRALAAR